MYFDQMYELIGHHKNLFSVTQSFFKKVNKDIQATQNYKV